MPARNHHSIGEVLSLLQDDFPDITISKIRFLESQGLISPERTPSGYRRFFERDLQRLRWILTQQRDHYLPLKVIREKLAAGEADAGTETASPVTGSPAVEPVDAPASVEVAEPVEVSPSGDVAEPPAGPEPAGETAPAASPQATVVSDDPVPASEGDDAAAPARAGGTEQDQQEPAPSDAASGGEGLSGPDAAPEPAEQRSTGDTVELLEASEAVGASEPGEPTGTDDADVDRSVGETSAEEPSAAAEAGGTEAEPPAAPDAEPAAAGSGRRPAGKSRSKRSSSTRTAASVDETSATVGSAPPAGVAEAGPAHDPGHELPSPHDDGRQPAEPPAQTPVPAAGRGAADEASVVALTRDELAEASGCSVAVLNDLERFGLLQGKTVGRGVLYDNDALVVARLAARFANHGLEPRHLRSFRLAAEREIGLFAQVVGPLLQRRDAMAHERAMETLTDLAVLASDLHEVLVQNLVSREFGNR